MRLRILIGVCAAGLALVGLLAALALVWMTELLRQQTETVASAAPHVHAAQDLEVALLTFERERQLVAAHLGDEHQVAMEAAANTARDAHAFAVSLADTPREQQLVRQTWANVDGYLKAGARGERIPGERAKELDAALASARALVETNEAQAERATRTARQLDHDANVAGLLAALLVVLGIGAVLVAMQLGFYRPLLLIYSGVQNFKDGRWDTRLAVRGPMAFRDVAKELNGMAAALESQREGQLHFLAGVAHDLRNPLHALRLGASSLSRAKVLPPEDRVREILGRMEALAVRISRMVEDLLDQTRVEAGHLELRRERLELRALVTDAVELHRPLSERHELQMELPQQPVYVHGDAGRLEQVMTNLISNAIKYSPAGGSVTVSVEAKEGFAWVAVTDQGVGIPPSEQTRIFEPFRRGSSTRDSTPGMGLGLSVARKIMQAHDGDIEVESQEGVGSTFRFHLEVLSVSEPSTTPAPTGMNADA